MFDQVTSTITVWGLFTGEALEAVILAIFFSLLGSKYLATEIVSSSRSKRFAIPRQPTAATCRSTCLACVQGLVIA